MQITREKQAVFNFGALRLAVNLRKNLMYFPPELQADFLTMTDFIQELDDYEEADTENLTNSIGILRQQIAGLEADLDSLDEVLELALVG